MMSKNKHRPSRGLTARAVAVAIATGWAAPTLQAQSVDTLETVVVTGTRQAYRGEFTRLEKPVADLVIDEEVLAAAGATDLDQALDLSASVARQNNFGGLWNSFAIRGFAGDENLPSGYLVNGFNAGRGFGGPRNLAGVESVEVLKGPRAALFGRGEPGGTVNLVTKRPKATQAGEVKLTVGRYAHRRADLDYNQPLSDAAGLRVVGYFEDSESFRDTVETRRYGANPSFAWRPTEAGRFVYELEYSRQEVPFDRGVLAVDGQLGRIPPSRFLGEPGDGPIEARTLGHQLEYQHEFNDQWSLLVGANLRDTSLEGFSTEPELAANRQQLLVDGRNLTRQRRSRDYDADYRVLRAELSGEFRTGGLRHRVLIGVDADKFENDQVFLRARAPTLASRPTPQQQQAIDIFAPVYGRFPLPTPGPLTDRLETQESRGIFLQDQISLTDRFEVRLGARFDDYEQTRQDRAARRTVRQTESRVEPQFGAVFKATDRLSWYAGYGRNFRPLSGADFAGRPFEPNTSTSIETGLSFESADGAWSGTAGIFRSTQENILVADPLNAGFSIAGGKAESRGLEIDLQGRFDSGLGVWFSYAYIDAEVSGDVLDPNFALPVRAGSPLINIPEHSLSLQVTQQLQLAGRPLTLGGGAVFVDDRLGETGTTFELPGYTIARVFAAYEITSALSLRADIDNLTDETYYTNSFSRLWVKPGTPRNIRVSAVLRF
ncbi:MAG: TonB-dependent siderophore receptor [Gammaproteobacteria bacterium]